ncbi:MAG: phosphopantothenoylcysteine decarboxylase [Flavobacteriales bacterium TMED113]|nr:MAG: phosphopantothenoylcysteine decarboxylase [Flavobacteriales bacterium TMED113]
MNKKSYLFNKKILLGITASISAYKSIFLVRLLVKLGAEVQVILTPSAKDFVSPLVLSVLSKNKVLSTFFSNSSNPEWNNHVDLALWADLILIAPASANTISKLNIGSCDNLLLSIVLSRRCPIIIAPAMDHDMFLNNITSRNINQLKNNSFKFIDVESGDLASGLKGYGRVAEPENIINYLNSFFKKTSPLKDVNCLVTAGPTYEKIDPVRFIGNYSSGKMGVAIANELVALGANVDLVIGPSSLKINKNINVINVESTQQMYNECVDRYNNSKIVFFSAAVSDYKPKVTKKNKIKKKSDSINITLNKTVDILQKLGSIKRSDQFLVGFALETQNEVNNAIKKMERKNLDMIVLNSLNDEKSCFGYDTNKVTIINKDKHIENLPLMSKKNVAKYIVKSCRELFKKELI